MQQRQFWMLRHSAGVVALFRVVLILLFYVSHFHQVNSIIEKIQAKEPDWIQKSMAEQIA